MKSKALNWLGFDDWEPLRGKPLLRATWNFVAEHPEKWRQWVSWRTRQGCGCFAVHALLISATYRLFANFPCNGLADACNLSRADAGFLFYGGRTMPELRARVVKICGARGLLPVPKGYE